jgi:hypothetical protein
MLKLVFIAILFVTTCRAALHVTVSYLGGGGGSNSWSSSVSLLFLEMLTYLGPVIYKPVYG